MDSLDEKKLSRIVFWGTVVILVALMFIVGAVAKSI